MASSDRASSSCLPHAMRDIAKAIRLDEQGQNKDAYVMYLQCVQYLAQNLLQDAQSKDFYITQSTTKCLQLGQNCLERLGVVVEDLQKEQVTHNDGYVANQRVTDLPAVWQPPSTDGWPEPPDSPLHSPNRSPTPSQSPTRRDLNQIPADTHDGKRVSMQFSSGGESVSSAADPEDLPKLPFTPGTESLRLPEFKTIGECEPDAAMKRSRGLTPLEVAQKQNIQLMQAYKARIARSGSNTISANLRLSLQRKLAENMAIGKAREQALIKKMRERHRLLQEEAERRFSTTTGMSKEEQERRTLYTSVMEYEHRTFWLLAWRQKLKNHPDDVGLMQSLIQAILNTRDHPLTIAMSKYQYRLYNKLEPLVREYLDELNEIVVPYSGGAPASSVDVNTAAANGVSNDEHGDRRVDSCGASGAENVFTEARNEVVREVTSGYANGENCEHYDRTMESSTPHDTEQHDTESTTGGATCNQNNGDIESHRHALQSAMTNTRNDLERALEKNEELIERLVSEGSDLESFDVSPINRLLDGMEEEERGDKTEEELKNAGLKRHLEQFVKDIKKSLEKLQAMFIIVYSQMDSPGGKEICCSTLEQPFFHHIWPFLLPLFRLVNINNERMLASVMTRLHPVSPEDMGVPSNQCPTSRSQQTHNIPYAPVISTMQTLPSLVRPLAKLECIVKICKEIIECAVMYAPSPESTTEDKRERKSQEKKVAIPQVGADDLLPIVCYVVAYCGMPQIISECHALEEFIHESYLWAEEGYCLTTLQTAVAYLSNL